jgi:hypothetical protein
LANFYREHTTFCWVVFGMVGFPLAGAIALALVGVVLWALTLIFGNVLGILVFLFGLIGAIAGFIIAQIVKENNG